MFYKWDNLTMKDIKEYGDIGIFKFIVAFFMAVFGVYYGYIT